MSGNSSRASDPKVESTFGIHPMLSLETAHRPVRKTGSTFPHDALGAGPAEDPGREFSGQSQTGERDKCHRHDNLLDRIGRRDDDDGHANDLGGVKTSRTTALRTRAGEGPRCRGGPLLRLSRSVEAQAPRSRMWIVAIVPNTPRSMCFDGGGREPRRSRSSLTISR